VCCCNCWALTLRTVCLNTEWAIGIWHSWLKHFNSWWKAVKNLICYSCIFNVQQHVHLKKWTLKFMLLYPRKYISYLNKIYRIYCVNTHIQSLKVWLKSILSRLKYSIFSRGLFFIGAPCISCKDLVNIGPVTSEFKRAKFENCSASRPQFDDRFSFGALTWQNGLKHRNFDYSILIVNHFSTLQKNLVRLDLVTPDFKT